MRRRFNTLGPGLVTGAADDDPSGIVTYSQAGAHVRLYVALGFAVQVSPCGGYPDYLGPIGCANSHGIAYNLHKHYPRWLLTPSN
ncbi:hypothetical protein CSQ89_03795 [Chitinimonas sp. BJB300]|nr:hypothetical protein CSQ89_03795 [Chitinimonas sp. BJB300]